MRARPNVESTKAFSGKVASGVWTAAAGLALTALLAIGSSGCGGVEPGEDDPEFESLVAAAAQQSESILFHFYEVRLDLISADCECPNSGPRTCSKARLRARLNHVYSKHSKVRMAIEINGRLVKQGIRPVSTSRGAPSVYKYTSKFDTEVTVPGLLELEGAGRRYAKVAVTISDGSGEVERETGTRRVDHANSFCSIRPIYPERAKHYSPELKAYAPGYALRYRNSTGLYRPAGRSAQYIGNTAVSSCAEYTFERSRHAPPLTTPLTVTYRHTAKSIGGDSCTGGGCGTSPGFVVLHSLDGRTWTRVQGVPNPRPETYRSATLNIPTGYKRILLCRGGGGAGRNNIQVRSLYTVD